MNQQTQTNAFLDKPAFDDTNEFYFPGGNTGVLLIHGFSSSPPEMRGLGDYLNSNGYTVMGVRLAGHGTTEKDMETTGLPDWIESARQGLRRLEKKCDRIFCVGHSMGGLISLQLTLNESIAGVVSLSSTMIHPSFLSSIVLPIARIFIKWYVISKGTNPNAFAPPYVLRAYPKVPTKCLRWIPYITVLTQKTAGKIVVPVLLLQGRFDRIAPQNGAEELYNLLGTSDKRLLWFENSGHMLTLDIEREKVWETILTFVQSH
ncbi:MAG: alpha/beta fold hydrolase [Anaerolineae bacterium]|nr:alpha/beta fold hydrolase [Anaerolineae bacterium]